jgi:tetratricopeptide (TPR) repeat protein
MGQLDKAVADFSRALELDAKHAAAWGGRGVAYSALGQLEKAVADYSRAVELDPKFAAAWHSRGIAYGQMGQLDKAVADFSRAIELNPRDATAWANRGNAFRMLGQPDKAVADYSRAIDLESSGQIAPVVNELAWLLATCHDAKLRNPTRAVELARKAVKLAPKVGGYWNTLGVAHYRAGEEKAAMAALEKALELGNSGDAIDWLFLAMAHQKLGQRDEARKWYDQAIQWMEKNREALKKDRPRREEISRFQAEAEDVLDLKKK